jgi:hypothetical protein
MIQTPVKTTEKKYFYFFNKMNGADKKIKDNKYLKMK